MTAKQILDAFSDTLMRDERVFSARERDLLFNLLRNAKAASAGNTEVQTAVTSAIAYAVGETVAQRAFALLGSNIVEQILAGMPADQEEIRPNLFQSGAPKPPGPQPPGTPRPSPSDQPRDLPPGPQPPGISLRRESASEPLRAQQMQSDSASGVALLDAPEAVRRYCVVLDEFLAPQELEELVQFVQRHESDFRNSEVISPNGDPGFVDFNHRRSRVLLDLGKHEQVILDRIRGVLPQVLDQLSIQEFPITRTEVQVTASNDGDFFREHSDDAQETVASRRLTFVYFFHRDPNPFEGGELRLYDPNRSEGKSNSSGSGGSYQTIRPQQNQIVFFPCSTLHEITKVKCSSHAFADSRFTLNGWLHQ